MVDSVRLVRDSSDEPLASEDLLFLSHHLLVRPTGWTGEVPIEILLNRNPLLGESVFRFWQRGFLALLSRIAEAPTFSEQRRLVVAAMLDEIAWRASHAAVRAAGAEDEPSAIAALLAGSGFFDAVAPSNRRYALDTRSRTGSLSMQALEFLAEEVFFLDDATCGMIETFRREARRRADADLAKGVPTAPLRSPATGSKTAAAPAIRVFRGGPAADVPVAPLV